MAGKYSNFHTGFMPEKILASAKYHQKLVMDLHDNKNGRRIAMAGANILDDYFGLWLDNKARSNPSLLHHVYEWGKAGDKNSRLFDCKVTYSGSPVINFYLTESNEPNESGYVFRQKASVMEAGDPVIIEPTNSEVLAFEIDDEVIFTPNEVHVDSPGGPEVAGQFQKNFYEFMSSEAQNALSFIGFDKTIATGISRETSRVLSKMFGDKVISSDFESASSSTNIATSVEALGNDLR